jgi:hypothetical protein
MSSQEINGSGNVQVGGDIIVQVGSDDGATPSAIDQYLKIAYSLLFISLIGTTLPHPAINTITSIGVIANFLLVCFLTWERRKTAESVPWLSRSRNIAICLTVVSIFTGCSGPMLAKISDPAIIDLVKDYKAGVVQGVGFFGFGLDDISVTTAAKNGGIEDVYVVDRIRGYGLISIAKISVFGD